MNTPNKPNLINDGSSQQGMNGELTLLIRNEGETAYFTNFEIISKDLELKELTTLSELKNEETKSIFMQTKIAKNIEHVEYELKIKYEDRLDNKYVAVIEGKGGNYEIKEGLV